MVKCLLEHGASVDVVTPQLRTPLIAAIANFSTEDPPDPADIQLVIEALVAAKADLNVIDQDGNTALTTALLNYDKAADQIRKDNVPASVCILLIEAG